MLDDLFVGDLLSRAMRKTASGTDDVSREAVLQESAASNVGSLMMKMARILGADIQESGGPVIPGSFTEYAAETKSDNSLEFAEALDKLAVAMDSKLSISIDENLRKLFGGDVNDEDKAMLNELEYEFTQMTGQPSV